MQSLSATSHMEADEITWNPHSNLQAHKKSSHKIDLTQMFNAYEMFSKNDIIKETELTYAQELSSKYEAEIYLKREDTQRGRTFKIRGAYYQYLISDEKRKKKGYCIVSDGNFASSFAIISGMFQKAVPVTIFVPKTCQTYQTDNMKKSGKDFVEVIQVGDDFQQSIQYAERYSKQNDKPLLKAFETVSLLHGFATIAKEIVDARMRKSRIDYILVPTGGGGLVSSIASVIKQISPKTKVISVEPEGTTPFSSSILEGSFVSAQKACRFCDGSSVKSTSQTAYNMGYTSVDGFIDVNKNKIAEQVIRLYSQGFICEPSAAMSVACLDKIRHLIKGKTIVCLLSGANMDMVKLDEARELSMVSKGKKNHFQFRLPNKKGVLYELINQCFKETDIISVFYSQRFGKEESQAVLSVESRTQQDVEEYLAKLVENKYQFENINEREDLLDMFF